MGTGEKRVKCGCLEITRGGEGGRAGPPAPQESGARACPPAAGRGFGARGGRCPQPPAAAAGEKPGSWHGIQEEPVSSLFTVD